MGSGMGVKGQENPAGKGKSLLTRFYSHALRENGCEQESGWGQQNLEGRFLV